MRTVRCVIVRACLATILATPALADDAPESDSPGFFDLSDLPELPPVKMRGALTYSFQDVRSAAGQKTMQHTTTVTATPSTFIYEPWIAMVNADINLSKSMTMGESSAGSDNITGTAVLNVLPQSDYPTDLTWTRYNRGVQLGEITNDLTGDSLRIVNRVTLPDDWALQSRASQDSSEDALGQGESSSEVSFDIAKRWVEDLLRIGLEHRESAYSESGMVAASSVNNGFSLRHRSQPFETVSTDSTSNIRSSSYVQAGLQEESTVTQGVTTAIWRPKDFYDLTVNGAFRTFQETASVQRRTDTTDSSSQTAYGTLSTSYVFQQRLVGNLGLNAGYAQQETKTSSAAYAQTDSTGKAVDPKTQSFSMGTNAGLDYVSEPEDWGGFAWNWNTGTSADANMNTANGMELSSSNHIGHTFGQQFGFLGLEGINLSLAQGTGLGFSVSGGGRIPVNHAVTLSHSSRSGKTWDVWNLSFSDNREIVGTGASSYDLMNVQVTQGVDPDRFSSLSANVNLQVYRQVSGATDSGIVDSLSGTVTYRERMVLGIENLNFTSDLSFNPPSLITSNRNRDSATAGSSLSQSQSATTKQSTGFGSQRWNNRLDYMIGQVRASLTARATRDTAGTDTLMLFQVSRRF